jgi:glycosyltransferase involved in cell wall biosynthesis
MPKVSIIIPNYNHAQYLEKRIQSVLDQTYQDFEIIYLDDVSTDNSNEVFAKFAGDKRIRAIYNQVNSGSTFKQWNKGMSEAKGEYVWIAESDDYADESLLAKLVAKLDEHPTVGIAYCQSWGIDSEGKRIFSWKEHTDGLDKNRWQRDFVDHGKNEWQYLLFINTIPNASAVLMRREVFIKAGKCDEQLRLVGDWMMWAKMLRISDIAFVAEPLNYFRTHIKTVRSTTEKNGLHIEEEYQVLKYLLDNMNLSNEIITKAVEQMAERWVHRLVVERGRVSWERNRTIYQIASSIDPKIRLRLIKKLSKRFFRKIKHILVNRIPVLQQVAS